MPEKRQHRRHKKRLTVKFGEKALTGGGYTLDVSQGGMFLVTSQLLPIKARLHVQLNLDATEYLLFEGEVRRQKVVPAPLRSVERAGLGVRFLHPGEVVREIVHSEGDADRYPLSFATREALQETFDRELRHGGVFIPTSRRMPQGTKVVIDVTFDFSPTELELDATVVHVALGDAQSPEGLGLLFDDPGVAQGFQALLSRQP